MFRKTQFSVAPGARNTSTYSITIQKCRKTSFGLSASVCECVSVLFLFLAIVLSNYICLCVIIFGP